MKAFIHFCLLSLLLLGINPAQAATVTYTGASGGFWHVGTNWSTGSEPTSSDDAVIPSGITVNCTTSVTIIGLNLGDASAGDVILNVTYAVSQIFEVTGDIVFNPNNNSDDYSLNLSGASGRLNLSGNIVTSSSSASNVLNINNSNLRLLSFTAYNFNNIEFYLTASGRMSVINAAGTLQANSKLDITGTGAIATFNQGATVASGADVVMGTNGTFACNGDLNWNQNAVNVFANGSVLRTGGTGTFAITGTAPTPYNWHIGTNSGPGDITLAGDIEVQNILQIFNSKSLDIGGHYVTINGSFNLGTTPTFVAGVGSTIHMKVASNSSNTTINTGATSVSFHNLTIETAFGKQVAFSDNIVVTGTLEIKANSKLVPGSSSVICSGAGTLMATAGGDPGFVGVLVTGNTDDFSAQYTITNKDLSNVVLDYFSTSVAQGLDLPSDPAGIMINKLTQALTLNDDVTLGKALYLYTGSIDLNGHTLSIDGDALIERKEGSLSAAPTFNGPVNVKYSHNGTVSTGDELPTTATDLDNLEIATTGGTPTVSLNDDITINGTLTFTTGLIELGTHRMTIAPGGTVVGASSTKYVRTNSSGTLRKTVPSGVATTFEIGFNPYLPMTVSHADGVDRIFDVRVEDDVIDNANMTVPSNVVTQSWFVTPEATTTNVALSPQWNGSDEGTSFDRTQTRVAIRDGVNDWEAFGTLEPASGANPYTTTSGTIASLTGGTAYRVGVEDNVLPLPVQWLHVKARMTPSGAKVQWTTAGELNNSHFEVERRSDESNWSKVATLEGAGTTLATSAYNTIDVAAAPLLATNEMIYYRIRQVDYNGKFDYSPTVALRAAESAVNQAAIWYAMDSKKLMWKNMDAPNGVATMYDAAGKQVASWRLAGSAGTIDIPSHLHGWYIIEVPAMDGSAMPTKVKVAL